MNPHKVRKLLLVPTLLICLVSAYLLVDYAVHFQTIRSSPAFGSYTFILIAMALLAASQVWVMWRWTRSGKFEALAERLQKRSGDQ